MGEPGFRVVGSRSDTSGPVPQPASPSDQIASINIEASAVGIRPDHRNPTTGEVMIGGFAAMMGGVLPKVVAELRLKYLRLTVNVAQLMTSPGVYDNCRHAAVIAEVRTTTKYGDGTADQSC